MRTLTAARRSASRQGAAAIARRGSIYWATVSVTPNLSRIPAPWRPRISGPGLARLRVDLYNPAGKDYADELHGITVLRLTNIHHDLPRRWADT